jgi:mono/diheme cytochrome c family protein
MSSASRRILIALGVVVVIAGGVAAYDAFGPGPTDFAPGKRVALEASREHDPTGVPGAMKSASLIERGQYLARAADCEVCHTAEGGAPFAGGRAFVLPFGTLYSTNITPDANTGIGAYSDANFLDALHRGIGRGGTRLYPAMPYASYTYMSDADALAIKAYLFSLSPVSAPARGNTLVFPFNQRSLMGLWSMFFNPNHRFEPDTDRDPQWNRGAYLAEAMAHCGECHTPRDLFFSLDNRRKFAGETQAGWRAYNITPDHASGIGEWSDTDLAHYLSMGHAVGRGTASGPMGEAVDASLRYLAPEDVAALVVYVRSVPAVATADLPAPRSEPAAPTPADPRVAGIGPQGSEVYAGACAGCHGWAGNAPAQSVAMLTGTRAVNDPTAVNVAQVILRGGPRHVTGDPGNMPAFGSTYSDQEVASVANYVTARFGARASALTAAEVAKLRAED